MRFQRIVGIIKSKWFGAICYSLFAALVAGAAYDWFCASNRSKLQMNMSCFAFRDINRNGEYDLGDRPYAGLKAVLKRSDGKTFDAQSNLSGFTNYKMEYKGRKAVIKKPGPHTITVEPPKGWVITTGNQVQTSNYRRVEGSPLGMAVDKLFSHVGIAPLLTISGRVDRKSFGVEETELTLTYFRPREVAIEVPLDEDGNFSIEVDRGTWNLVIGENGNAIYSRQVEVGDYPVFVSELSSDREPLMEPVNDMKLEVIRFDDITPSDTLMEIPNGYRGLDWNNWVATHQKFYGTESHVNAVISSEYMSYTSAGHPSTIASHKPFDFVGVYFTALMEEGEQSDMIVKAWRGDVLVYEDRWRASSAGPTYFDADYVNINRLEFSNEQYWHALIDDFEFRKSLD